MLARPSTRPYKMRFSKWTSCSPAHVCAHTTQARKCGAQSRARTGVRASVMMWAGMVPQMVIPGVDPMVCRPPRRTKIGHEERATRPRSAEGHRPQPSGSAGGHFQSSSPSGSLSHSVRGVWERVRVRALPGDSRSRSHSLPPATQDENATRRAGEMPEFRRGTPAPSG